MNTPLKLLVIAQSVFVLLLIGALAVIAVNKSVVAGNSDATPSHQQIINAIIDGISMEGEKRHITQTTIQCQPGQVWRCTGIKTASGAEYSATIEVESIVGQIIILPAELTITKEPPYKELETL